MLDSNDKLLERMTSIMEYSDKAEITNNKYEEEAKKSKPSLEEYLASLPADCKEYDLDEYGIKSLQDIPFNEDTE